MNISFASSTNIGPRSTNQDRLLEPQVRDGYCLSAIADGMGGAEGGALAADIAIELTQNFNGDPDHLDTVFSAAVLKFRELREVNPVLGKMGTTLSIALLRDNFVYTAHVGDTRIYHIRGAGLKTLTEDQTEIAELRRKGVLSQNQARRHPRRNVLLSALTPSGTYDVHYNRSQVEVGDRLLLVTDGVHQTILKGAIINGSVRHASINGFIDEINGRASVNEPSDNFSAIGIQIDSLDAASASKK